MKRFTHRSVWAIALALLLTCSLFPAAFADFEGQPPIPLVRHAESWPVTADEGAGEAAEPEILHDSQTFKLLSEEELWANVSSAVSQKVYEIVTECRAAGVTGEYETALWLHDWLINHATYDKTLTIYTPDGVLLYGSGVCQSYRTAFQLLLDKAGIENTYISSQSMNHTWNVVKIDGKWCHIDVTWDDPISSDTANDPIVSGSESHTYFGMTDALIRLDHSWSAAEGQGVPAADSLLNYYPVRNGYVCYTNDTELDAQLSEKAAKKESPIEIMYIGSDSTRSAYDDFYAWYQENRSLYGMQGYSVSYTQFSCTVTTSYGEIVTYPAGELDPPKSAPNFTLSSSEGNRTLAGYRGSGLLLIFGQTTCGNTRSLLSRLESSLPDLKKAGVDVLAVMIDASKASDLNDVKRSWPGYSFCFGGGETMWSYLHTANSSLGSITPPAVFVVNPEGKISYYSTGPVRLKTLLNETLAAAPAVPAAYDAVLPAGTTLLEEGAFQNTGFTSIDLTTGELTAIGERAFAGNAKLRFVKLPASVSSIAQSAFDDCPNVTLICPAGSAAARLAESYGWNYIAP